MSDITINVNQRITDNTWMLFVRRGSMVEHVELYKYVGYPVNDEAEAMIAAAKWCESNGVTPTVLGVTEEKPEQGDEEQVATTTTTTTKKPRVRKKTTGNDKPKAKRTMSAEHKAALAEGRASARIVNAYLSALESIKPKRGRQRTAESVQAQLDKIEAELGNGANGVTQLSLVQQRRDLTVELASLIGSNGGVDIEEAQAEFVKVAKAFGDQRGISYGSWREVGVPADVLKEAGITRSKSE